MERIRRHIVNLEGVRHPAYGVDALKQAASYIAEALDSYGYPVHAQPFTDNGQSFDNIIATRNGNDDSSEQILVIAHYDTVPDSPGADDNASGVAVLLELARILKDVRFDRTVQFVAVNLEEDDIATPGQTGRTRGSRALAQHARKREWQIAGAAVFEMVAFAGESVRQTTPEGLPIRLPDIGDFIGVVGNERSKELVDVFASGIKEEGIDLPVQTLVVPENGKEFAVVRRSDHAPFWDSGFKAIMITDTAEFRNPHYHLPTDTVGTLNIPFAANVCRAAAVFVSHLARSLD